MSLADVVRSGVAVADGITKPLQDDVLHTPWTGDKDEFGNSTFASSVFRKALVEKKMQLITKADGQIVMAATKITFVEPVPPTIAAGRDNPIDGRDILTLSDGTTGPILTVGGFMDAGTHVPFVLQVYLG
jgi:hypothetical protein